MTSPPRKWVGWDVGAWHCDRGKSRDALVFLSEIPSGLRITGNWRGNLRETLNGYSGTRLIQNICALGGIANSGPTVIAIDTPLGWPFAFQQLLAGGEASHIAPRKSENTLLLRETERALWGNSCQPLSAVEDMIGSQSTKGIQFLRRTGLGETSAGIFSTSEGRPQLTAIETYPTPCRQSRVVVELRRELLGGLSADERSPFESNGPAAADTLDALTCAVVAWLFDQQRSSFADPPDHNPTGEGWIWVPKDLPGNVPDDPASGVG